MGFLEFSEPDGDDPRATQLKNELTEIILWAENSSTRSQQMNLGPSEISSECDRQIGYRMAGIPTLNEADPWAAIVGTAIHNWLEIAVDSCPLSENWITEKTLQLSSYVEGHCDLYRDGWVIDYKTAGVDRMREVLKHGPPAKYKTQVHCYGLAYEQAGYPVSTVALVFLPRSGLLRKMYVWAEDYDPAIGQRALARVENIGQKLVDLDILNHPHRWEQISNHATRDCGYCPWYSYDRSPEDGASDLGCPGK